MTTQLCESAGAVLLAAHFALVPVSAEQIWVRLEPQSFLFLLQLLYLVLQLLAFLQQLAMLLQISFGRLILAEKLLVLAPRHVICAERHETTRAKQAKCEPTDGIGINLKCGWVGFALRTLLLACI